MQREIFLEFNDGLGLKLLEVGKLRYFFFESEKCWKVDEDSKVTHVKTNDLRHFHDARE